MTINRKKVKRELRIIGCSDPLMWYSHKVGKSVPFVRELEDCFISREPTGYVNIVRKEDAEIVYT